MSDAKAEAEKAPAQLPATASNRRMKRRSVSQTVQYAIFVVVLLVVAFTANWHVLASQFVRLDIAERLFPRLLTTALKNTVIYTLSGFVLGLLLGLVIALMRLSQVIPYRVLAGLYIEFFRGLPALVIFMFVGVGIPLAFPGSEIPGGTYGKVALGLGLVSAAYMAETIRAGIQAVPKGQMEAARSLGFSHRRAMLSIILPQAFRIIIPPLTNELVLLFKDSSLVLFLGVTLEERELTKFGRDLASETANTTPIFVAGLCYLIVTIPLGYLVRRLEARANAAQGRS